MDKIIVSSDGWLECNGLRLPCALGKNGVTADKIEGDSKTPLGNWPVRRMFYRPDRVAKPQTTLETIALTPQHGWCDDAAHPLYNTLVTLPFAGRHEELWREDTRYNYILELGYNDAPIIPGKGSAIFLHVATKDRWFTEGCIALLENDVAALIPKLRPTTQLHVTV